MIKDVLYSSRSDEWSTPQDLFDDLDNEFHFMIDVCASADNAKCPVYFSKEQDGLSQDWGGYGTVWCNPPYGRQIVKWIKKASDTAMTGETVVMLIHARTDTRWFHDYIYQQPNVEIRFIKGRVKFGESKNNAPFPSMIVIFRGEAKMIDYVSRNELKQAFEEDGHLSAYIEEMIDAIPAAEVRPVKRGRWISHDFVDMGKGRYTGSVECSACGRFLPLKENYCPNCGAWMGANDEKA